jgi:hypothetical protein
MPAHFAMSRSLFVLVLACAAVWPVAAQQRASFDAAYRLYETGDCSGALTALRSERPSPRVDSLRGLCLYATGDLVEARLAFTRYQRMLPAAHQSSAAHQSILAVIAELDEALRAADRDHEKDLQRKRMQRAEGLAAQASQRLEQQRQRAAAEGSRGLMAQYTSGNKEELNAALRSGLDGKSLDQLETRVKSAAQQQTRAAAGSLKELFSRYQGRSLPTHPFPALATAGMATYGIDHVALEGKTIDYRVTMADGQGRRINESGTLQGFDLSRIVRYTTSRLGGQATEHVFEFDAPLIWRRGGVRYADGAPFAGDVTSSQGERVLRMVLPSDDSDFARDSFSALIDAAKAARLGR